MIVQWRAFAREPMDSLTLSYLNMQTCVAQKAHTHLAEPSEYMRLAYITLGEAVFSYVHGELRAREGDMLYWPSGMAYASNWLGDTNRFAVIDMRVVDGEGCEVGFGARPRVLFKDEHRLYAGYMNDIEALCGDAHPFAWLERISLALKLCCEIAREQLLCESASAYSRIYAGLMYLEAHFAENFPVDDLAKMCSMSATSFRKLFFEYKGMPPVDYRNSLRVRRAAEIMRAGASAADAAEAVGVSDMKYFAKLFKRFTGVPPGRARAISLEDGVIDTL